MLVSDVATDSRGHTVILGTFGGSVDFDLGPGTDLHSAPPTDTGLFVTMIERDGTYGWTRTIIQPGDVGAQNESIAVAPNGDVLVVGAIQQPVDFDPGPEMDTRTPVGRYNAYLWRLSSTGDYVGTLTLGEGNEATIEPHAVAIDRVGNVYITGTFNTYLTQGPLDFDPTDGVDPHSGIGDVFLTRIDADGSYGWTRTFGANGYDDGNSIAVDPQDNIFLHGSYRGIVDFDPGPGVDLHTAQVLDATYVSKFYPDGARAWTNTLDHSRSIQRYHMLAVGPEGSVYLTGSFSDVEDFDPSPDGYDWKFAQGSSGFLTRYAYDGTYLGTSLIGAAYPSFLPDGALAIETGSFATPGLHIGVLNPDGSQRFIRTMQVDDWETRGIAISPDGSLTVAGNYRDHADFDPGCAELLYNNDSGVASGFVVHLACVTPNADANGDGRVNLNDMPKMLDCLSGPGPIVCHSGCYGLDVDGDDDIDLIDFANFQSAVGGLSHFLPPFDCSPKDRMCPLKK